MGQGHGGAVGVPRVWVGLEGGCGMVVHTPLAPLRGNGAWCHCRPRAQLSSSRPLTPSTCACTCRRGYTTTGPAAGRTLGPATSCRWWAPYIACRYVDLTRYSSAARACPRLPSSCLNTTMLSSHSPCTAASLSRPPASPGPVSWRGQPRITPDTYVSGSGACPASPCGRGPQTIPALSRHPPLLRSPPSRPPVVPPRHRDLRALDVLLREYQYPLTLHVQEAGPLIVQQVHPLYHTIQAPARVAGGCATLLYRAPDLTVTSHSAHPSGRALVTHFTVAGVTH